MKGRRSTFREEGTSYGQQREKHWPSKPRLVFRCRKDPNGPWDVPNSRCIASLTGVPWSKNGIR